jgi:DinB superfamily
MDVPPRLAPLLEQYDWGCLRLLNRMTGPLVDSGNGTPVEVPPMSTAEYLWEPVPGSWSVRPREGGPGPRATMLMGAGDWGRDSTAMAEQPYPPPFTTIAWRLSHLGELLLLRSDYTTGSHSLTSDTYVTSGEAAGAIESFVAASDAWRATLLGCDDAALDTVGLSTYPYGSDAEEVFIDIVWWVNQEVLHHGAEIALLRDLYRDSRA